MIIPKLDYPTITQSLLENNEVMVHTVGQPGYRDRIKECLLETVAMRRMGQRCSWR